MKLKNNRQSVIILSVGIALFGLRKSNEPRYQGMTAREWFEAAASNEASLSEFEQAVDALPARFLSVFLSYRGNWTMLNDLERSVFRGLPSWARSMYERLRDPTRIQRLDFFAGLGMAQLGRRDSAAEDISIIYKALNNAGKSIQGMLLWLTSCYLIGEQESDLQKIEGQIHHSAFPVRYCAMLNSIGFIKAPPTSPVKIDTNKVISVMVQAITNLTMMEETFGKNASHWRRIAIDELSAMTPATAAKYPAYMK